MRLTAKAIYEKKKKGEKITALTAYDFPLARIFDEEGVDILLVGDSVGMVLLGYESTLPVTMEEMLHHVRPVARAARKSLVVADMPYKSYETPELAVQNAKRFIEEAGAGAVKLEGGETVRAQIEALTKNGFAVMGHVGMTPQTADMLGGYRVQGRDAAQAEIILNDARLLDRLGVFSVVLECIPAALADKITREVRCPTIGIGAGPKTDGQVLVSHDMLGFRGKVRPKFVRQYAAMEEIARDAVRSYRRDVLAGKYPSKAESY